MYNLPYENHPTKNITCSGEPSPHQLQDLKNDGYTTIISLKTSGEYLCDIPAACEGLGLELIEIPIAGRPDFNRENAEKLHVALNEAGNNKVLVFCGSSNRVGGLMAIQAYLFEGAGKDEALQLGEQSGMTKIRSMIEQVIDQL